MALHWDLAYSLLRVVCLLRAMLRLSGKDNGARGASRQGAVFLFSGSQMTYAMHIEMPPVISLLIDAAARPEVDFIVDTIHSSNP